MGGACCTRTRLPSSCDASRRNQACFPAASRRRYNPSQGLHRELVTSSLLATKLYTPQARADTIARSRLTRRLLEGLQRPGSFALISAPAGFGKTTLLSEFVA